MAEPHLAEPISLGSPPQGFEPLPYARYSPIPPSLLVGGGTGLYRGQGYWFMPRAAALRA